MDDEGVSFTEREYDYAVGHGLPALAFVHADPNAIPTGKTELEAAARAKLDAFRGKVQKRLCKNWRTADELGGVVSRSLVQAIKTRPAEGWVRARHATSPEQLNALRAQIDDLTRQLQETRVAPPAEAEGLAKAEETFIIRYKYSGGSRDGELELTWDEIFAVVGPAMFGEAAEFQLKQQLEAKIESDGATFHHSLRVNEEDFQTVKVQLFALGLIHKSIRKRTASDTHTYWTLTPYGERYATVLKAIRRSE
jgi:hypothetical protein